MFLIRKTWKFIRSFEDVLGEESDPFNISLIYSSLIYSRSIFIYFCLIYFLLVSFI